MAALEAVRAGLAVVQARVGAHDVRLKGPRDPVTGTDLAGQAAIENVLRRRTPTIAFVGEEGDARVPDSGDYWLVDPLCGTGNFAAGLPLYAINVALVKGGEVTIGVAADGVTGEVYAAERGRGAWLSSGEQLKVNPRAWIVSLDFGLPGPGKLKRFGDEFCVRVLAEHELEVVMLSTTLALEYLARGWLAGAVYVCEGPPVHFAAGLRIAEEAGAIVTDEHGQPWRVAGPIYVAAANPTLHAELCRHSLKAVEALTGER
jgi:myo-inositol-1(or 4)-monophosphatase